MNRDIHHLSPRTTAVTTAETTVTGQWYGSHGITASGMMNSETTMSGRPASEMPSDPSSHRRRPTTQQDAPRAVAVGSSQGTSRRISRRGAVVNSVRSSRTATPAARRSRDATMSRAVSHVGGFASLSVNATTATMYRPKNTTIASSDSRV